MLTGPRSHAAMQARSHAATQPRSPPVRSDASAQAELPSTQGPAQLGVRRAVEAPAELEAAVSADTQQTARSTELSVDSRIGALEQGETQARRDRREARDRP